MYSILIVDDEPAIREGLKTIIPWEQYGFHIRETAANGRDALERCRESMPDLVIADILMPGVNGLDLIEELRNENETVHFLILSGYSEFEYAQRALASRVDAYIMKPVDEKDLSDSLAMIRERIDNERRVRAAVAGNLDRGNFLWELSQGNFGWTAEEVSKKAHEYEIAWDSYQVLLLHLHHDADQDPKTLRHLQNRIEALVGARGAVASFPAERHFGLVMMNPLDHDSGRRHLNDRIHRLAQSYDMDISCGVGTVVRSLVQLRESYDSASRVLNAHFFLDVDTIPTVASLEGFIGRGLQTKPVEINIWSDRLLYALEIQRLESIENLVREWTEEMSVCGYHEQKIKTDSIQIVTNALNRCSQSSSITVDTETFSRFAVEAQAQINIHRLRDKVAGFLAQLMNSCSDGNTSTLVKKMIDLINRSYCENLKLESLAGVFNYSSAYLGKLFHNVTGVYFNTYLDQVRIQKAKDFLDQGMKVYEVAEKVGYSNVDYFHGKFRKYVGMAPTSYRKHVNVKKQVPAS